MGKKKDFIIKWIRRFFALIAVKLVLFAFFLMFIRFAFVYVENNRERALEWLVHEYHITANIKELSGGVDFSGAYLSLNHLTSCNSVRLPYCLKVDHVFLHIDLWKSLVSFKPIFNRISLLGVDIDFTKHNGKPLNSALKKREKSHLKNLQLIFLTRLKQFSIRNAQIHYLNKLDRKKSIFIDHLYWTNNGVRHQGVGRASLQNLVKTAGVAFIINVKQDERHNLSGTLYVNAKHLDLKNYSLQFLGKSMKVRKAKINAEIWMEFNNNHVLNAQLKIGESQLSWRMMSKAYDWKIATGLVEISNSKRGWLLDTYDFNITNNGKRLATFAIHGKGEHGIADFNLSNLTLAQTLPFYFILNQADPSRIVEINKLKLDARIDKIKIEKINQGLFNFAIVLRGFKNHAVGDIPALKNADIDILGNKHSGHINIRIAKQKIDFDGKFNRVFLLNSANIALQWQQTKTGVKFFSKQISLNTNDLRTNTEFSLFLDKDKVKYPSPFLSLYTEAQINNLGEADHYYPIKTMGLDVYNYLLPILKKGTVKDAKFLWYGVLSDYPYVHHHGIFQAYVPLKNTTFNFYKGWEALTGLDGYILLENNKIKMSAHNAKLGKIKVDKLVCTIDNLGRDGILTIKGRLMLNKQKAESYLLRTAYKASVEKAFKIIDIHDDLDVKLKIIIPFNTKNIKNLKKQITGQVKLHNNDIYLKLPNSIKLSLKHVNGILRFVNEDFKTNIITGEYLNQPVKLMMIGRRKRGVYKLNANVVTKYSINDFKKDHPEFTTVPLSGAFDWQGKLGFAYDDNGAYRFSLLLTSTLKGIKSEFPFPFTKNAGRKWPLKIQLDGNKNSVLTQVYLAKRLAFQGMLERDPLGVRLTNYYARLGHVLQNKAIKLQKNSINVNLPRLDVVAWYNVWKNLFFIKKNSINILIDSMQANFDIKTLSLFEQSLKAFRARFMYDDNKAKVHINSNQLIADVHYRQGTPNRFIVLIDKLDFNHFNLALLNRNNKQVVKRIDISKHYPEIILKCRVCLWNNIDFSSMYLHVIPLKNKLKIVRLTIGKDPELLSISGNWDQTRTKLVVDLKGKNNQSILTRIKFTSPVTFKTAKINAVINWRGPPWKYNPKSFYGSLSAHLKLGSVTQVSDRGTRFLSIFSLDGIMRTIDLSYGNIFDKGFNFDDIKLTAYIKNGIFKSDDFYLNGPAGKIIGKGFVDLPNEHTNLLMSYSPALSNSLPILAAFAINPITGAAALFISKLMQPMIESIVRVDLSVKGPIFNPKVEIIGQQDGIIKLKNVKQ
ncbi:MAG: TIGR02099 family protein [Psychromonas sp.]|nr:TIGR02099 family protein [Psychromonas sp.]